MDEWNLVDNSRFMAERIPGAGAGRATGCTTFVGLTSTTRIVELPSREFLCQVRTSGPGSRPISTGVLATVLFTDIVGRRRRPSSSAIANRTNSSSGTTGSYRSRSYARLRGREVDTAGDGFFATFDGPAAAILRLRDRRSVASSASTSAPACTRARWSWPKTSLAASPSTSAPAFPARAEPGEVLVSNTVKDLVAGSGIEFDERGTAELKGVPGEWRLYAVRS